MIITVEVTGYVSFEVPDRLLGKTYDEVWRDSEVQSVVSNNLFCGDLENIDTHLVDCDE